ncbi:MAG: dihydrolipoyl dehydrogenase [Candidatus Omnitrophota bacterium]
MNYDLIIIGSGWAGFNAALKAKDSGLKVAVIENSQIGGTCLNRGCIPTKALIQSAKVYSLAKKSKTFGIEVTNPAINFPEIQSRKDKIIQQLSAGMAFMLKGVDFINAEAKLISANSVKAGGKELSAKFILIACGSTPAELRQIKLDGKKVISSDEILQLRELPKTLLIIGGGVIGCEFAGLFAGLGITVTVIEKMPQLLPGMDKDISRKLEQSFKKKGIKVSTNAEAQPADFNNYDLVLLAVGRAVDTQGLGLESIGVVTEKGKIVVDEYLRTNIPNIYAAGDCTGKLMLAHYAAYQGVIAAENIADSAKPKKCDNQVVPSCIFTDPQAASVGMSEEEAIAKGIEVKLHKFDFMASGMARIMDEADGFIKFISEAKSGVVLGCAILGPSAAELIAIAGLAVSNKLSVSQIRDTIFAHPSLSEGIHEALK